MLPAEPGTYVLVLRASSKRAIQIGRLGALRLQPGFYLYVGSAFAPAGLRARIEHHSRRAMRPHWHMDYLRRFTRLEGVWYCCGERREHELAAAIGALPGAVPMPGFGSSDCGCGTHLLWFQEESVDSLTKQMYLPMPRDRVSLSSFAFALLHAQNRRAWG